MNNGQSQPSSQNQPNDFEPDPVEAWARANGNGHRRNSDSGTEREFASHSPSDPSPNSRSRHFRGLNGHRSSGRSGSAETTPDPGPPLPYWVAKRHLTCGNPTPDPHWSSKNLGWRGAAPGKLKTATAALVICLNIDVDPPDVVKTNPCAVMECWVDPHTMPSHKALEAIGSNLQHQFEGLSVKISYKPILDPSLEDLKRFCQTLRKTAKDDAILFYYNGHGVPKPTPSGELWCFNRNYTQYIPVSLQEVQTWLGSPGVYIWDCSAAGNLLNNFNTYGERRDQDAHLPNSIHPEGMQPMMNSLQLAACGANETLPTCPELPADLFTSCLTSPLDIALRYFIMNHQLPNNITADMVMQLPGDLKDRRTPLGELNWIFTAVTDTIAWTTFSREIFTRLYRCDLLIASLFRNFLLAERIMKNYHCTPHTYPPLPATNTHPLWATWDLAVDTCLRQLPQLLGMVENPNGLGIPSNGSLGPGRIGQNKDKYPGDLTGTYIPSRFFADQLKAFEVWISRGGSALTRKGPLSLPPHPTDVATPDLNGAKNAYPSSQQHLVPRKPPDQLPIVLQVLLSQPHRLRALILLSQFVELGPWAVHLVLTIGIFPYISKLLQAAGPDLRPVLTFIWSRILAVDSSVQTDLFNSAGYRYFSNVLGLKNDEQLPNSSEHKAMCSFILASISRDFQHGQSVCWNEKVFDNCHDRLEEPDFLLKQWTALCIGQMWAGNDEIKIYGIERATQEKLFTLLTDQSVEVRAAALFAVGTFLGATGSPDPNKRGGGGTGTMYHLDERAHFKTEVVIATGAILASQEDASPMCRKEVLVIISCIVKEWRGYFVVCAWIYWEEDRRWRSGSHGHHNASSMHYNEEDITGQAVAEWLDTFGEDETLREENRVLLSSFFTIFVVLLDLSVDPYPEVATNAQTVVDYVMALLLESPFARLESASLQVPSTFPLDRHGSPQLNAARTRLSSLKSSPSYNHMPASTSTKERPTPSRNDTMSTLAGSVTNTLKRTSSFANALKVLTGSIAFPSSEDGRSSPGLASTLLPSTLRHHDAPLDISRPPSPNMNVAQYASPYSLAAGEAGPPSVDSQNSTAEFMACDVIAALIEEDMERLRARRKAARKLHPNNGSLPSPSSSTFSMDSNASSVILGLGTGSGIRDVLPLKSTYFDWCAEYFKEPQMRQTEADEPGSIQYNYQVWRQNRNEQVVKDTEAQAPIAEHTRWDRPISSFNVSGHPLTMTFHAFDKHLIIANEHDIISVWDWSTRRRLNYFCNGNPKGTSITSMKIINQDYGGLIVAGSADGVVRLYRNYDPTLEQGPLQMVSAFRALNEMIQLRQGSGLVMDWKTSGRLLTAGDARVIRNWNAQTETVGLDISTNSESPVTAISSDASSANVFAASFADGVVKVFDCRLEDDDAIVRTYADHSSWVQNVCWHPTLGNQIVSASLDGQVKLFDLRGADYASQTWNAQPHGLSSFDVHPLSGVFGTNSSVSSSEWRTQRIHIQSFKEHNPLSVFNVSTGLTTSPNRGLPSPYIPRYTSFAFHPTHMIYANGGADGSVRIMGSGLS